MKTSLLHCVAGVVLHTAVISAMLASAANPVANAPATTISPAPCTAVSDTCTEWVALGKGKARAMIYRTFPLMTRNPGVHRALIMVHGTNRNPDHYFATATSAGFFAGALEDTVIISPAIRSADRGCNDKLQPNEVSWSCLACPMFCTSR